MKLLALQLVHVLIMSYQLRMLSELDYTCGAPVLLPNNSLAKLFRLELKSIVFLPLKCHTTQVVLAEEIYMRIVPLKIVSAIWI